MDSEALSRRYRTASSIDARGSLSIGSSIENTESIRAESFIPKRSISATWKKNSKEYEPTPVRRHQAYSQVARDRSFPIHFVDYGSGKGRVLLPASEYPYRNVIGVEFSPALHLIAENNIEIRRRRGRIKCRTVQSICMDATEFDLPQEPLVLFFFTPFEPPVADRVIGAINADFRKNPRPIQISQVLWCASGIYRCAVTDRFLLQGNLFAKASCRDSALQGLYLYIRIRIAAPLPDIGTMKKILQPPVSVSHNDICISLYDLNGRSISSLGDRSLGSSNRERVLLYLNFRKEGYAREISRYFRTDLTPVQKQLETRERWGAVQPKRGKDAALWNEPALSFSRRASGAPRPGFGILPA